MASKTVRDGVGLRGYRVQDPARMRARREEILLAMAQVIGEKGYADTTLEDVAARIGTSRAVIYYQFRNKEELYMELILESVESATRRLQAIVDRGLPPTETLELALRDLMAIGFEPINQSTLRAGRPRALSPAARKRLREVDHGYSSLLEQVLREGIADGSFVDRDPAFLTYTIIFSTNGVFAWRRADGALPPEYFIEHIPAMLLAGVVKPG